MTTVSESRIHVPLDSYENGPRSHMYVSENGIYIQVDGKEFFSSGQANHLLTLVNIGQSWSSNPAEFEMPVKGDEVFVSVTVPHWVISKKTVTFVASKQRLFDALNALAMPMG